MTASMSGVEKSQDFITVKESRCLDARLADRLAKEGTASSSKHGTDLVNPKLQVSELGR